MKRTTYGGFSFHPFKLIKLGQCILDSLRNRDKKFDKLIAGIPGWGIVLGAGWVRQAEKPPS